MIFKNKETNYMSKYRPLWEYISKYDKDKMILTYEEIDDILGFGIDHSFLTFKKELQLLMSTKS